MLEVSVSIPLSRRDWPELESMVREEFGPTGDTGIGLGYSDTNFPVKSKKNGNLLKQEIWAFLKKKRIPVGDTPAVAYDGKTVIVAF
jgi:hypothetical protein